MIHLYITIITDTVYPCTYAEHIHYHSENQTRSHFQNFWFIKFAGEEIATGYEFTKLAETTFHLCRNYWCEVVFTPNVILSESW